MTYEITTTNGRTIILTDAQTARYDAGDSTVVGEVAAALAPGDYSLYLADGGPLVENIRVG